MQNQSQVSKVLWLRVKEFWIGQGRLALGVIIEPEGKNESRRHSQLRDSKAGEIDLTWNLCVSCSQSEAEVLSSSLLRCWDGSWGKYSLEFHIPLIWSLRHSVNRFAALLHQAFQSHVCWAGCASAVGAQVVHASQRTWWWDCNCQKRRLWFMNKPETMMLGDLMWSPPACVFYFII